MDVDDRHLLAMVAVWVVVGVVAVLGGAAVLGLAVKLFLWMMAG